MSNKMNNPLFEQIKSLFTEDDFKIILKQVIVIKSNKKPESILLAAVQRPLARGSFRKEGYNLSKDLASLVKENEKDDPLPDNWEAILQSKTTKTAKDESRSSSNIIIEESNAPMVPQKLDSSISIKPLSVSQVQLKPELIKPAVIPSFKSSIATVEQFPSLKQVKKQSDFNMSIVERNRRAPKVALGQTTKTFSVTIDNLSDMIEEYNNEVVTINNPPNIVVRDLNGGNPHLIFPSLEKRVSTPGEYILLTSKRASDLMAKYNFVKVNNLSDFLEAFSEEITSEHELITYPGNILCKKDNDVVVMKPIRGVFVLPEYYQKCCSTKRILTAQRLVLPTEEELITKLDRRARQFENTAGAFGNAEKPNAPVVILASFGFMLGEKTYTVLNTTSAARFIKTRFDLMPWYVLITNPDNFLTQLDNLKLRQDYKALVFKALCSYHFTKHLKPDYFFPVLTRSAHNLEISLEVQEKFISKTDQIAQALNLGNYVTVTSEELKSSSLGNGIPRIGYA